MNKFDQDTVRQKIYDFYITKKKLPPTGILENSF